MIRLLKVIVILGLLAVIGAGAFGAYYIIVLKPRELDRRETADNGAPGQSTPDPSDPDFEKARALRGERKYDEARVALGNFLNRYPDSTHRQEAEALLGEVNVSQLLSGGPGPNKVEYIVQRGDVLDRVAHKTKSNSELIFRANNLERVMLQIGQKLQVPQVDLSVEAHLGEKKLVLINRGQFLKSYKILDARPLPKKVNEIRTKVAEKLAFKDGKRVSFGSREYPGSLRSLSLVGQPNYTISGRDDAGMTAENKPPVNGIGLNSSDTEELHTLVSAGAPVTITAE